MTTTAPRRRAALAAGALVAGLLPVLLAASPAAAAETCLADDSLSLFDSTGCDDVTPPDTQVLSTGPGFNDSGYIRGRSATFTFRAVVSDADTGPWSFLCRLDGASQGQWADCSAPDNAATSSVTYPNLADRKGGEPSDGYTFSVYAIDKTDAAVSWTDNRNLLSPVSESAPDDDSASPASASFLVDTRAPNTFIFGEPYDRLSPELPMTTTPNLTLLLDSNESATGDVAGYLCTLNRTSVPCRPGASTLKNLSPGTKRFTAAAVDLAGNRDPSPATTVFSVPTDLTAPRSGDWRTVRGGSAYFGGDYLETDTVGSSLTTKPMVFRELRLIAPAGPRLGTIEVQIGDGVPRPVRLTAAKYQPVKVYVLRDEFAGRVGAKITIRARSLTRNQVVRVDAVLAR